MPRTRRKLHERQSRSIGQDCPHQRKLRKKQDRLSHKRDRTRLEKEIDNQNITIDNSTYRKTYLTSGEDRFSNCKNTNSEIHTDNVKGSNWFPSKLRICNWLLVTFKTFDCKCNLIDLIFKAFII